MEAKEVEEVKEVAASGFAFGAEEREAVAVGVGEIGGPHGAGDDARLGDEADAAGTEGVVGFTDAFNGEHNFGGAGAAASVL